MNNAHERMEFKRSTFFGFDPYIFKLLSKPVNYELIGVLKIE